MFVGELVTHLAARDDLAVTGYAVSWRGRDRLAESVPDGVTVARRPMMARPLHQLWMRGDFPRVDHWVGRQDLVWGTNYVVPPTRATSLVSVYDMTTVRYPELTTTHTQTFPGLIRRALRRGASVHTMSGFVRDEIVEHFGVEPERVHVVPGGIRASSATRADDRPTAVAEGWPYVLALGTVEPRKDLPTLVAAFDALADDHPDLRLVIAGADGWGAEALTDAIATAAHRDRIVRLGWVEEHDRPGLLQSAAVYAYPSLYEGFGFPPLEAMSVGVPVVATRTGSLPEVCGDAADLVPVDDMEALAQSLGQVLTDDDHRKSLIDRGYRNVARFSWETASDQFAELLHQLIA